MRWWAVLLAPATMAVLFPITLAQQSPMSSLPWLIVPLLMARSLGDSRSGIFATLIVGGATVGYFQLNMAGLLPEPWLPADTAGETLLNIIALLIATYVIGDVATNGYEGAVERLQARQDELTNEIASHQTTQSELRDAHDRVVQTARVAGMAEIATGVLHNVGNALNTVGVTAQVVRSSLANTESIDRLHRVATLVETGQAEPAAVAKFLRAMAKKASNDATRLTADMARLAGAVEHVANVVSAQQAHARSRGVVETVSIQTILDDVLPLTRPKLDSFGVDVKVLGDPQATLTTERHQVVQVLENLVRNGAEAMVSTAGIREIRIETIAMDDMLCIRVSDTGPGVNAEDHGKVFQHGFTKKATGSGFGLHVSSLACKGLGGSLELEPNDSGGACFTVWLPKVMPDETPTVVDLPADDVTELIALPTQLRRRANVG
jgi:C4-dicarboxylate-specific signal transduction histidine kinase